jgi:hypothetical protein
MTAYRMYHLVNNRIKGAEDFTAQSDIEALAIARDKSRTGEVEVWSGDRKLRMFIVNEDWRKVMASNH